MTELANGYSIEVEMPIPSPSVEVPGTIDLTATVVPVQGEQGPPGLSGAGYTHDQVTPASTWTIVHNLQSKPPLTVVLAGAEDEPVFADVTYPDLNTAVVELPTASAGKVYM
jgi:hypothetical protein